MNRPIRHTEELAVETLYGTGEDDPGLLNRLLTLTSGEPTTEELEEALILTERQVLPTLRAWISSRHIINGRKNITGETGLKLAAAMSTREFVNKLPEREPAPMTQAQGESSPRVGDSIRILSGHWATREPYFMPIGTVLRLIREDDGQFLTEPLAPNSMAGIWVTPSAYGPDEMEILPSAQVLDPETEAAFDELEARAIENAHVHPGFAPALDLVQRRPA